MIFSCLRCQVAFSEHRDDVVVVRREGGRLIHRATCPLCGKWALRFATDRGAVR